MSWEVRKKGGEFVVCPKGTKKVVGTHSSKEEAQAQVESLMAGFNSPAALKKRNITPNYANAAKRRRTT